MKPFLSADIISANLSKSPCLLCVCAHITEHKLALTSYTLDSNPKLQIIFHDYSLNRALKKSSSLAAVPTSRYYWPAVQTCQLNLSQVFIFCKSRHYNPLAISTLAKQSYFFIVSYQTLTVYMRKQFSPVM